MIKDAAAVELLHAMRAVLAEHTYLSPEVAGAVYDQVQALAAHPELSEQEREVLRLISEGLKTPEIGKQFEPEPEHRPHVPAAHNGQARPAQRGGPDQIRGQHGAHYAVAALSRQFLPPAVKTAPVFVEPPRPRVPDFGKNWGFSAKCTR